MRAIISNDCVSLFLLGGQMITWLVKVRVEFKCLNLDILFTSFSVPKESALFSFFF